MKRLIGVLLIVAALCALLAVPAGAAKPVKVSGTSITTGGVLIELRPIGQGDDDHYCQVTVELTSEFSGDIRGEVFEHYEILQRGPCDVPPATFPDEQRAWGTFTGEIWDGEQMHAGTCKTFWRGGYYLADDGETMLSRGNQTLHTCTGGLQGAHANLDFTWDLQGPPTYTGRAFFSKRP